MTAPSPRQFEQLVDELFSPRRAASYRRVLIDTYTWTHGAGHDRTVQEQARIRSTNPSTPTESIAASKAHIRKTLEIAVRNLSHAKADLEEAARRMSQALDTLDPAETPDPVRYIDPVSKKERELSYDARSRRHDRNEAIP